MELLLLVVMPILVVGMALLGGRVTSVSGERLHAAVVPVRRQAPRR